MLINMGLCGWWTALIVDRSVLTMHRHLLMANHCRPTHMPLNRTCCNTWGFRTMPFALTIHYIRALTMRTVQCSKMPTDFGANLGWTRPAGVS